MNLYELELIYGFSKRGLDEKLSILCRIEKRAKDVESRVEEYFSDDVLALEPSSFFHELKTEFYDLCCDDLVMFFVMSAHFKRVDFSHQNRKSLLCRLATTIEIHLNKISEMKKLI